MRILLVEDNADHRELMSRALTGHDPTWQVDEVESGEKALRRLAEGEAYDLVFLDYSLPGRGGMKVLKEIRRGEVPPPVVMVTGRGDEQVAVEAMKGGAYDYVTKVEGYLQRLPVVVQRAVEAYQLAVERKRAEERVQREAARTEALVHVAARLNAQLDLDAVLSAVCEETARALNIPAASVSLYDEQRDVLYHAASVGLPPEYRQLSKPMPRALYDEYTARLGSLIAVPDILLFSDLPDTDLHAMLNIHTVIAARMQRNGQLIGALGAMTFGEPRSFTVEELALFKGLADQAGLAIANARLFEQVLAGREQLRELTGYLHTAREEERTRIAREIHDEFGQVLTALKMDLAWIAKRLPEDQTTLREKAGSMSELIGNTLHMVHRIATELRPGLLDDLGLVAAIEWQAQEFTERTGIECELYLSDEEAVVLDQDLATTLFRIFQETLTNVARHAGATIVRVDWQASPDELVLIVRDNGKGITESQVSDPKSLGLVGMREYTRSWGGKVTFEGAPGQGTVVTVSMPQARI